MNKIFVSFFISIFAVIAFFIVIFFFSGSEPCYGCGLVVPVVFLLAGPGVVIIASFLHRFQIFKKYSFYSLLFAVIIVILMVLFLTHYLDIFIDNSVYVDRIESWWYFGTWEN